MFSKRMLVVFWFFLVLTTVGCGDKADSQRAEKAASRLVESKPSVQRLPLQPSVLTTLRKEHPRLLFTMADQRRIEKLAKRNMLLAEMIAQLKRNAEWALKQPICHYEFKAEGEDRRLILLRQSRECLVSVMTLSMAYRLTGENRFADRARKEMLAVSAFETWNPSHFLDVGEMCCAVAIGYDWLYDTLSQTDRAIIRNAIVTKALKPGLSAYKNPNTRYGWWTESHMNWNLVCNGGLVLGALAVADEEPEIAAEVVSHALQSVRKGMASYKPDGAWYEGPVYWHYGTTYDGMMMAALGSALGSDFRLSKTKGFDKTGLFWTCITRPTGTLYNYGDCYNGPKSRHRSEYRLSPIMFWMARKFNRPLYARFEREQLRRTFLQHGYQSGKYNIDYFAPVRFFPLEIALFDEQGESIKNDELPRDAFFRGIADVVTMRSACGDEQALYVGFKGGDNNQPHVHMDIGSFVLDADGIMWVIDLGADSYSLPGYGDRKENGQRWKYYRLGSKSHNTLVIGDKLQRAENSESKVVDFLSTPERAHAVVDMTNAYRGQAEKVLRGVAMLDRSAVLVQDEITCLNDDEIRWGMVTPADIKLDGAKATLTQEGRTLSAEILSPAGAKFEILSTAPPTEQENPNKGASMLAVFVKPQGKGLVRLAILLTPIGDRWQELPPPQLEPLIEWKHRTKPRSTAVHVLEVLPMSCD